MAGGSENWGTEQEHLNNVFGARLRITTLRAARGPGVELLEYLAPTDGRPYPADARANDLLHWETIAPNARDNFATYPFLLAVAGRSAVLKSLDDALSGDIKPLTRELNSHQWYHPTLWGYLWNGIKRKVW